MASQETKNMWGIIGIVAAIIMGIIALFTWKKQHKDKKELEQAKLDMQQRQLDQETKTHQFKVAEKAVKNTWIVIDYELYETDKGVLFYEVNLVNHNGDEVVKRFYEGTQIYNGIDEGSVDIKDEILLMD